MIFSKRPLFYITAGLLFFNWGYASGQIPRFDKERSFEYLKAQCRFGPRNPGSVGHKTCLEFLVNELEKSADRVIRQPFFYADPSTQKTYCLTNVIASFGKGKDGVLFCAHWDTRPWADRDPNPENRNKPILGANDGASGVAVLLEVARILKEHPPSCRVELVLFDGEDSGTNGLAETWCLGSRYFAQNKKRRDHPRYAVLLDMVGDRDLSLPVEGNSIKFAPDLVHRVWANAERLHLTAFNRSFGPEVIDDHLELLNVGIPAIDIIDFDYPDWHTLQDTEDKCSPESLEAVGTLLLHLIYE